MLNINLALFKCYWGDEIGISRCISANPDDYENKFVLIFEGKLPSIIYDVRDNSFETKRMTFSVDYSKPDSIISQIQRGHSELGVLLSELKRLINLPLNEKYEIISKNLSLILGEFNND